MVLTERDRVARKVSAWRLVEARESEERKESERVARRTRHAVRQRQVVPEQHVPAAKLLLVHWARKGRGEHVARAQRQRAPPRGTHSSPASTSRTPGRRTARSTRLAASVSQHANAFASCWVVTRTTRAPDRPRHIAPRTRLVEEVQRALRFPAQHVLHRRRAPHRLLLLLPAAAAPAATAAAVARRLLHQCQRGHRGGGRLARERSRGRAPAHARRLLPVSARLRLRCRRGRRAGRAGGGGGAARARQRARGAPPDARVAPPLRAARGCVARRAPRVHQPGLHGRMRPRARRKVTRGCRSEAQLPPAKAFLRTARNAFSSHHTHTPPQRLGTGCRVAHSKHGGCLFKTCATNRATAVSCMRAHSTRNNTAMQNKNGGSTAGCGANCCETAPARSSADPAAARCMCPHRLVGTVCCSSRVRCHETRRLVGCSHFSRQRIAELSTSTPFCDPRAARRCAWAWSTAVGAQPRCFGALRRLTAASVWCGTSTPSQRCLRRWSTFCSQCRGRRPCYAYYHTPLLLVSAKSRSAARRGWSRRSTARTSCRLPPCAKRA